MFLYALKAYETLKMSLKILLKKVVSKHPHLSYEKTEALKTLNIIRPIFIIKFLIVNRIYNFQVRRIERKEKEILEI